MNKSKIEWCDYTWNPVTGCLHGCEYCYARRQTGRFKGYYSDVAGGNICDTILKSESNLHDLKEPLYRWDDDGKMRKAPYPFDFEPTYHRYRLDEPQKVKKSSKIFVVSMGDLFGDWVPDEWQSEVYNACGKAYWHRYLFLTKNPKAYSRVFYRSESDYRCNFWLGTTVTDDDSFIYGGAELFQNTGCDSERHAKRFLSIEPLIGKIDDHRLRTCIHHLDWVIIGQQTGPGAKPPKDEWVQSIIDQCREAGVPVFVKSPLYGKYPIQEYPEGLK